MVCTRGRESGWAARAAVGEVDGSRMRCEAFVRVLAVLKPSRARGSTLYLRVRGR